MAKPRMVWNPNALYDIRRDPAVVAQLDSAAEAIAGRANANGEGTYATGSRQGAKNPQGRWRASVVTVDYKAMRDNLRRNTLLKAMGNG